MTSGLNLMIGLAMGLNLVALASSRLPSVIRAAAVQGMVLGVLPLLVEESLHWMVALVAIATLAVKGFVIPGLLRRALRVANIDRELAQLEIALVNLMLAVPKRHPLAKSKSLRLRDLSSASFIWFPRRESPLFYDRLMHACFRGGLKSPHIVQEGVNEATILSGTTNVIGRPVRVWWPLPRPRA